MRRLFVIVPAALLLASLALIAWQSIQLKHDTTELRERVEILERHLDATGQ